MWQMSVIPLDVPGAHDQIKLCYAFTRSSNYHYQELSVLNPSPTQYDPAYIFPRDLHLYFYHRDQSSDLLPLGDLVDLVVTQHAPIHCVGSHRPDMDRTIQLIWMPPDGTAESQLIAQFVVDIPANEKISIIEGLQKMARHIGADSHVI